ncbi:MAG: hypothetical protein ACI93R_003860 [Flavobacteriales bacterium]|jgi:hypothetical protein
MKFTLIFIFIVMITSCSNAERHNSGDVVSRDYSIPRPENFEIEYKTPLQAYEVISSKSNTKNIDAGDIVGYADFDSGIMWVFTKSHNPAHPAVMKLRAFENESSELFMKAAVICGASKIKCDEFVSYQKYLKNSVVSLYSTYLEFSKK